MTLVHGNDYVSSAMSSDLDWLQAELENQYEIMTQRTREEAEGENEAMILNRIVRRTSEGYELEADPRHSELIVEELTVKSARSLSTPGISGSTEEEEQEKELEGEHVTKYRALTARCNYLSMDRPDLQYAVKEVCREMSKPFKSSWATLQRIGQYLKGKPRLVWRFDWQNLSGTIDVFADANWAGCTRTRKSTSGGCTMIGQHCIKTWPKTLAIVAKSSA